MNTNVWRWTQNSDNRDLSFIFRTQFNMSPPPLSSIQIRIKSLWSLHNLCGGSTLKSCWDTVWFTTPTLKWHLLKIVFCCFENRPLFSLISLPIPRWVIIREWSLIKIRPRVDGEPNRIGWLQKRLLFLVSVEITIIWLIMSWIMIYLNTWIRYLLNKSWM